MDRSVIRDHLEMAERHVALSDRHIAQQIDIIDNLKRGGHPTMLALDLLDTYRALRATHVAHRDQILKELA